MNREKKIKLLQQQYHRINEQRQDELKLNKGKGNRLTRLLKNKINDISKALDLHLKKLDNE